MQLKFIVWYTGWLGHLQEWPGSCPCHQERFFNNEANDCSRKRKLLNIAYPYIMKKLDEAHEGLAEAESWTAAEWCLSFSYRSDTGKCSAERSDGKGDVSFFRFAFLAKFGLGFGSGLVLRFWFVG